MSRSNSSSQRPDGRASSADLTPARPWAELPAAVADYLEEALPGTADEIVATMRAEIPAYREALEGRFGENVPHSVRAVLDQFVVLVRHGEEDLGARRRLFRAFGREEAREGRSLDALLAAYRIGARLAWRRTRDAARGAGLDAETMSLLAEATFSYIDTLSAVSAEGYSDEQSARAGTADRRRAELVQLLTAPVPPERTQLAQAAAAAQWGVPASVAVLVAASTEEDALRPRLPHGTLLAAVDGLMCAVVADANGPGRREELARGVGELLAVLGPTLAPHEAGRSLRRAAEVHALAQRGLAPGRGLVLAEEHLAEAVVHGSPELLEDLRVRALAPLAGLTERTRARQAETLLSWLEHHGDVAATGRALHVHPQTVRYRLAQLRDLFGEALVEPRRRFALLVALRGDRANRDRGLGRPGLAG